MRTGILKFSVFLMAIFGAAALATGTACKKAADNAGGSGGSGSTTSGVSPAEGGLKSITASSALTQNDKTHAAANLMDQGNASWCVGKSNNGLGESFTLTFGESVSLTTFRVRNGIGDGKLYSANNRVKKLLVNGVKVKLKDQADFQTVNLPKAAVGESIKFEIGSVHQGAKYRVTCITEIAIEGVKAPASKPADTPPAAGDVKDPKKTDPNPKVPGKDLPPPPAPGE